MQARVYKAIFYISSPHRHSWAQLLASAGVKATGIKIAFYVKIKPSF